jgi:sugar lactone lactonase YvrE
MQTGIRIPNSLCWSPDGRTMYFADSPTRTIFAYPFDPATGELGERRDFATVEAPAIPDGATVDAEGFVWCAHYDGWRIVRFAPAAGRCAADAGRRSEGACGGPLCGVKRDRKSLAGEA